MERGEISKIVGRMCMYIDPVVLDLSSLGWLDDCYVNLFCCAGEIWGREISLSLPPD